MIRQPNQSPGIRFSTEASRAGPNSFKPVEKVTFPVGNAGEKSMNQNRLAALIIAAVPQRSHRGSNGLRSRVRPADFQATSLITIAAADAPQ